MANGQPSNARGKTKESQCGSNPLIRSLRQSDHAPDLRVTTERSAVVTRTEPGPKQAVCGPFFQSHTNATRMTASIAEDLGATELACALRLYSCRQLRDWMSWSPDFLPSIIVKCPVSV